MLGSLGKGKAKAQAYNTYIAPKAANAAAVALFVSQTERAYSLLAVGYARAHGLRPATKQPYAALVCRIMVSTPVSMLVHGILLILPTIGD